MLLSQMARPWTLAAALGGWLVTATLASAQTPASLAPPGWDADVKLAEAEDTNPDPNVVEVALTARIAEVTLAAGQRVKAWTYNGQVPGPLIRAKVGNRVIVHFENDLDEPTTIHWHGVRLPIEMDGVPGISQEEVKTGESFTYDFTLRDAGLFWYHPHAFSAAQVGFGLYGALLVEDPAEAKTVGVADELTIVLSDIAFNDKGVLDDPDNGDTTGMVFGREGDHILVNGKELPTLTARANAPQRWRIVNAAKSRHFWLTLEDDRPFTIIGGDGGLNESSVTVTEALITPGERLDLIVTPTGAPGSTFAVRSLPYNRGYGSTFGRPVFDVFTVKLSEDAPVAPVTLPKVTREITPPSMAGATRLELVMQLPPIDRKGHNEFRINGVPWWKAKPYTSALGETQIWTVKNDTDWGHPFHLHGYSFIVLDDNDQPVRPMAWKDTVNIPIRATVKLLVKFDERPGEWMFHCHILDHAEGGLMGTVQVGEPKPGAGHMDHTMPSMGLPATN